MASSTKHMYVRRLTGLPATNQPQGIEQASKLEKGVVDQHKYAKVKMTGDRTRELYDRHCKIREILWKQEEVQTAYSTQEQSLNAMDYGTFEGYYELICSQHKGWWEDRFTKAREIMTMEKEVGITESRRYTGEELLAMDAVGLGCLYNKVLSAYTQHLEIERGGSRLAPFAAEERKKFGTCTAGDELAHPMELKLRGTYFYDTDSGPKSQSNASDAISVVDDDYDDDGSDGLVLFKGYGASKVCCSGSPYLAMSLQNISDSTASERLFYFLVFL